MANASHHLDVASAEAYLMRYLAIDGVTGQEKAIAEAIRDDLIALGVPASAIRFDDAASRIPLPTETGNLIVDLPGTRPGPASSSPPTSTPSPSARAPSPGAKATGSWATAPLRWAATTAPAARSSWRSSKRSSSTTCPTRRSPSSSPCARKAASTARANSIPRT